jgi:hypothetical protein
MCYRLIVAIVLQLATIGACAQALLSERSISVRFVVDGKPTPCDDLKVQLRVGSRAITPEHFGEGFIVPDVFNRRSSEWSPDKKVGISVNCGKHEFTFTEHPSWVSPGTWTLGIAFPPYWFEEFRYTPAVERGRGSAILCSNAPGVIPVLSPRPPTRLLHRCLSRD